MSEGLKRGLVIFGALAVIAGSCTWIYFAQTTETKLNTVLHQRVGEILAEQTAELAGHHGKVVTIAIPTREWPELKVQLKAFNAHLKKLGQFEVRDYEMDTKDQPKYGLGTGLSGRRYVRTVNKNTNAVVVVSFIGAPKLDKEDLAELKAQPKLIAEARGTDTLPKLFKQKLIDVAVVMRFQFPSPGPENPRTPDEWFARRYQIVTATNAHFLPKPEGE